ncbi:Protein of unknown function [Bacillus wiedmannii]|nr:Protein of unknown function [Bacillus wiedmannii]
MTLRSWQEDGHTKFGQWIKDNKLNQWKLIAIMDHPVLKFWALVPGVSSVEFVSVYPRNTVN